MPLVENIDFNALVDKKTFLDHPLKNKDKSMKNVSKCQKIMTIQQETY